VNESQFVAEYAAGLGARVVWGEDTVVDGSRIATWGIVSNADDSILAAGVTFGMKIVQDMPAAVEGLPAGAFASLQFPEVVRFPNTYFEHVEIQPEPNGHIISPLDCYNYPTANLNRNFVPHFDFHFYSIPQREVLEILAPAINPPLLLQPWDPRYPLLPAGYFRPGYSARLGAIIADMGRHSSPCTALDDPAPLSADMLAGFLPDASKMHFIEPMISQDRLLQGEDFELATPMPYDLESFGKSLGRPTLYPQKFEARFLGTSWAMIFSDFKRVPFAPAQ